MKKRTLRILVTVGVLISVLLYFYFGIIHIGNVKGLVLELENQSVLQDYFAHKNEDTLQANFNENIERKILENSKFKTLRDETFLVKVDQDFVAIGVKSSSKISQYFLKTIFSQYFFKDSILGDVMLLEQYGSYRKPLQTQYKKFGNRKNFSNDAITKEIKTIVNNAESNFSVKSYYVFMTILWVELKYNANTKSYEYRFDRNKDESYLKKEADYIFNEEFDAIQLEYYDKLKAELTPLLKEKKVSMILFKSHVPFFSEIPPPL